VVGAITLRVGAGDPDRTVLGRLNRAGFAIPGARCRRGGCGVCRVRLIAGAVEHGPHTTRALPASEQAKGKALACRAVPTTCVVVVASDEHTIRPVAQWGARMNEGN
jgi:CDP-4-dehydro-6-deoxyglucose reductase